MRLPAGFVLSAALVAGVALQTSDRFLPVAAFFIGLVALVAIWVENYRVLVYGALLLAIASLGMVRVQGADTLPSSPPELGPSSEFTGIVLDVPQQYPTSTNVRLEIDKPAEARVWGHLPAFPAVAQGDVVRISGSFASNDRSSFRGFAAQHGTAGVLTAERVAITGNEAARHQRWRTRANEEIRTRLRVRVPEPAGAFATGVILGDDGAMTEATRDSFRVGGLTHMTAVSGVHVGIIAAAILLVSRLGLINRWWMLVVSVPIIWSFAYLVGMRPSVVRASIMLTLLIAANLLGRPRDTLNAVGLAAAIMLMVDPSFRYDVGFQLSVAATTGIALGVLLIGQRSHWHLVWVVPVAAQLATEPLILYHFGYYSLVSPLANIIATPFLAITMAMSILTVLGSFVSVVLADSLAIATWVPASAVLMIADAAANIPYLSDDIRPLSLAGVWSAYAILTGVVAILFVVLGDESGDAESDFSLLYRV